MAIRKKTQDIEYRYSVTDSDKERGRVVNAYHPEHGIIGHLSAGIDRRYERTGLGMSTKLAYVHPEYRRQGVATAMFNILSHQMGYTPTQDSVRTDAGDKWARSTGAPLPSRIRMRNWDIPAGEVEESIAEAQRDNWERGEKVDPTIANALTPVKAKRAKKGPKYDQLQMDV